MQLPSVLQPHFTSTNLLLQGFDNQVDINDIGVPKLSNQMHQVSLASHVALAVIRVGSTNVRHENSSSYQMSCHRSGSTARVPEQPMSL